MELGDLQLQRRHGGLPVGHHLMHVVLLLPELGLQLRPGLLGGLQLRVQDVHLLLQLPRLLLPVLVALPLGLRDLLQLLPELLDAPLALRLLRQPPALGLPRLGRRALRLLRLPLRRLLRPLLLGQEQLHLLA